MNMKYSETIEPLDNEDRRIFYKDFVIIQIIAYTITILTGIYAFSQKEFLFSKSGPSQKILFIIFFVGLITPILIFLYGLYFFRIKLNIKYKTVKVGRIKQKEKIGSSDDNIYIFLLEGSTDEIVVTKKIYNSFTQPDCIKLHIINTSPRIICRAEKIT